MKTLTNPWDVGWYLGSLKDGRKSTPLWGRWDRTCGVLGAQGSGKSLDLLLPTLMNAPGAAMVTLTKPNDLLLAISSRRAGGRPVVVLDPFDVVPGLPRLVPDLISGCENPLVAEKRAMRFTSAAMNGQGRDDTAAQFYAGRASFVLMCYLHAAALHRQTLKEVMGWIVRGANAEGPKQILANDPLAAPGWASLLSEALSGDERTVGNTMATLQSAVRMFVQPSVVERCMPSAAHPATDIADVIRRNGTFFLLGRDDPHVSVAPLMTAVCEEILDTALDLAQRSIHGRLTPPFCAVLDELPSVAPIPSLTTRMANERALGVHCRWAAQTKRQLLARYGVQETHALIGLSNTMVIFGGTKDAEFLQEISTLVGNRHESRVSTTMHHTSMSMTNSTEERPTLRPDQIAQIPRRHALVLAEQAKPMIVTMRRCIDGRDGKRLLEQQQLLRHLIAAGRAQQAAS